jgi:hypothetical protein
MVSSESAWDIPEERRRIQPATALEITQKLFKEIMILTWSPTQHDSQLLKEFKIIYPDLNDFVNSTAAVRVNGYLDGYGSPKDLEDVLTSLGLSPNSNKKLSEIVRRVEGSMGERC